MSSLGWMTAVGALLLVMALSSSHVERLPISTSFIYLLIGLAIGPLGLGLLRIDMVAQREMLELLCEFAVIVSLFVGGLRLRLPLRHSSWRPALLLAGPVMIASIAGATIVAAWLLQLPIFLAILLAAMLAPTDPVLASAVSVNDAEDHDQVRFALSGEAGLNDGAAFPFVVFALEGMRAGGFGEWVGPWFISRLLWAVPAGLGLGYLMGLGLGLVAIRIRVRQPQSSAPNDFLALALIALSYAAAEGVHAWGFLSVFAAGVGLRHAEVRVVRASPHPDAAVRDGAAHSPTRGDDVIAHPPSETLVPLRVDGAALEQPSIAAGVLISEAISFGETIERSLEVLLVVLVGIVLNQAWSFRAALLALVLFCVIRPLATITLLRGTQTTSSQRRLLGWFGIRGIGSMYYLSYALTHGVHDERGYLLVQAVVTVIACSIVLHGVSVTPVLRHYEQTLATRRA